MIARFLSDCGDYDVLVGDADLDALARLHHHAHVDTLVIDAANPREIETALRERDSVISALSYRFNPLVAKVALA